MGTYLLFALPFLLLAMWASYRVKSTFAHYNQQPIRSGVSGAEAAQIILRAAGITDVGIEVAPGMLSDHYDPAKKVVALSAEVLNGRTQAAVAVAAHEVGHAIQHAQAYAPMQARSALVPVVGLINTLAMPMFLAGIFMHLPGLALVAVIAYGAGTLFHLVTLPVEFDASRRAIQILERSGIATADEMVGVRKTLFAAGFTYVAATLVSLVDLIYWLWRAGLIGGAARSDEA